MGKGVTTAAGGAVNRPARSAQRPPAPPSGGGRKVVLRARVASKLSLPRIIVSDYKC